MNEALARARALLETVTPLNSNCGRLCDAACCQGNANEGMLLFPGEETCFADCGWASLLPASPGNLLVCRGSCPRDNRPLGCRMFPLRIALDGGAPKAIPDIRAWPVCPLMPHGLTGLSSAFVDAVTRAGEILAADEEQLQFLRRIEADVKAYEELGSSIGL